MPKLFTITLLFCIYMSFTFTWCLVNVLEHVRLYVLYIFNNYTYLQSGYIQV
jgi:hypothetical protein